MKFEGHEAYGLPDTRQAPKYGKSGTLGSKRDIRNIYENGWLDKRDIWISECKVNVGNSGSPV